MAQAALFDREGREVGKVELPSSVFDVPLQKDLVHQVVVTQGARRRQGTAHTKTRGEVSGGGRKPWRQKHTGRARHGSIRSPLWKGGGVTFGPRSERTYGGKINTKMRRKALLMLLSEKAKDGRVLLLQDLADSKTREVASLLGALACAGKSTLLVLPELNQGQIRASRNVEKVAAIQAKDLNALDAASASFLVMPEQSLRILEQTFVK